MDQIKRQIADIYSQLRAMGSYKGITYDQQAALTQRLGINTTPTVVQVFPVGFVFISTNATNPGSIIGYGTWVAFGAGQVLVGYSSGDANFGTLGGTGGEKTHTLSITEMPNHSHTTEGANSGGGGVFRVYSASTTSGASEETATTGGGGAHNNIQPYIVVTFWLRTA